MKVIWLEHSVSGDPNRMIVDNVLGEKRMNAYLLFINSGKKALTLNLAEPDGQTLFHTLIKELNVNIFI
jgi:crotonobetainyl-CoA:carnitine CoA-transferase CaiB-like acyl-CoA transferase